MRRIATVSALAALLSGLPLVEASAGGGVRYRPAGYGPAGYGPSASFGPFGYFFGPPGYAADPRKSYAFWRPYYTAQAERAGARRVWRGNYFVAFGYNPPSRLLGPPTNFYAENYALDPLSYFGCPLARRGEGICSNQPPLSAVPAGE